MLRLILQCSFTLLTAPVFLLLRPGNAPGQVPPEQVLLRLASFEEGSSTPFRNRWPGSSKTVLEHATDGRASLLWRYADLRWAGNPDWTGYDVLAFDVFNPAETLVRLVLEIRDDQSSDYWSRVNHPLVILPGASTVEVPLPAYTGEKSRPGRLLRLQAIRSLVLARSEKRWQSLYIDNFRLLKNVSPPPGLLAFDFGPGASPVFPGMRRFTKDTRYSVEQGFGLRNAAVWDPYPQASDALQPDLLYRDSLLLGRGEILIDLPPDEYLVFMNLDHPGGFWGEFPYYRKRNVYAEDALVVEDRLDRSGAAARYFEFSKLDDWPSEDVFDKYFSGIFREKRFSVEVTDGQLNLRFESDDCSKQACFGLALSTVILAPRSREKEFEEFLARVRAERRKQFNATFVKYLRNASPAPAAVNSGKPAIVSNDYMTELVPWESPGETGGLPLKVAAAQGQTESLTFSIAPAGAEVQLYLAVSDLIGAAPGNAVIPAAAVDIALVAPRLMRVTMDGSIYTLGERYLRPAGPGFSAGPGRYNRVWATFKVPPAALPGYYRGHFEVRSARGQSTYVPVELEVYPFKLEELDIPAGPFNSTIQENFWPEPDPVRMERLEDLSLAKMREVGLTAFSASPQMAVTVAGGRLQLNAGRFNKLMHKARQAGFLKVVGYGHVLAGFDLCHGDPAEAFDMPAGDFYKSLTALLDKEAQAHDWLPVDFIVCDEPLPADLPRVEERMEALQAARPQRIGYTVAFSSSGKAHRYQELLELLPHPFLNLFDDSALRNLQDRGRSFCFYNRASRRTFGFYMYRLRAAGALDCRLAWNWNQNAANPYFALDSREDDYSWCNSTEDGKLLCSVILERHIRAGVNDYRYALTLQRRLNEIKDQKLKRAAEKLLRQVAAFDAGSEVVPGEAGPAWRDAAMLRAQIAELLKTAGGG